MPDPNVSGAGDLRERVHLQSRATVDDGFGNQVPGGAFATVYTVAAHLMPLRGSESVMASRLGGKQPYVLTVRQSSQTREVNEAWRVLDARNAERVFSITAPPTDPDGKRTWFEFLVVEGGES